MAELGPQKATVITSYEEIPLVTTRNSRLSRGDIANGDFVPDRNVVTGWDRRLLILLFHGLISLCWGIALAIFASRVVPVAWALSEKGRKNPEITNVLVALASTLTTMHITYILQGICDQYTSFLVVDGFTVGQLRWMQGVKELSAFTKFPDKENFWSKKRIGWLIVYLAFALHSASVVAILQPESFFKHFPFGDWVPCGSDPNDLTLERSQFVDEKLQAFSFTVGMQLGNYNEQVAGNTTSRIARRTYRKDGYAYGIIGGLQNGLQEVPGVQFVAQCSSNSSNAEAIWRSVFPDRSLPELAMNGTEFVEFTDAPVPAQMRSVDSEADDRGQDETLGNFHNGLYALVQPNADGALITVEPQIRLTICSWKTVPKLIHAQTIDFTARSLEAKDATLYPTLIGRATWFTLQGMAHAARYGSSLQAVPEGTSPPPSRVLETILADGGKAAITVFNEFFWPQYNPRKANKPQPASAPPRCDSRNRTVAEHWRFGNSHNLGYIAIVLTTGIGIFAVWMVFRLKPRRRMRGDWTLGVAEAFELGKDEKVSQEQVFCVVNGKMVERN
ncbi:hypothetical protein MD484_g6633, partial [Candolleomyces efflorescens]